MNKHFIAAVLAAGFTLCGTGAVQAQVAGQTLVKLGWNNIMPKVESGALSAPALSNSQIDVGSASSFILTAAYMWTDNVSIEFLGGLPYKHDLYAAGGIGGAGKIGSLHQISPTLLLQYRFLAPQAVFRPYIGAGVTYAIFYDSEGTAKLTAMTNPGGPPTLIGGDRSFGMTAELGATYKINEKWFVDAALLKTYIDASPRLSTGQSIDVKLNPVSANISVGYRF